MALDTEVVLSPGHIVLDEDPAPHERDTAAPTFRPISIGSNGWMDQDTTWYRGRPRPRRRCVKRGHTCSTDGGTATDIFGPLYAYSLRSHSV